jgi:hypothetical protein
VALRPRLSPGVPLSERMAGKATLRTGTALVKNVERYLMNWKPTEDIDENVRKWLKANVPSDVQTLFKPLDLPDLIPTVRRLLAA